MSKIVQFPNPPVNLKMLLHASLRREAWLLIKCSVEMITKLEQEPSAEDATKMITQLTHFLPDVDGAVIRQAVNQLDSPGVA